MKTDKNSQTATTSGTLPQPEQTVSDSNQQRKYAVHFHLLQKSFGTTFVNASSLREARKNARHFSLSERHVREVIAEVISIVSVEFVKKGGNNE
jgi:hypothetical protein